MRLFFAICLPINNALANHLETYGDLLVASGYRLMPRDKLHLTLNFIGEADRETTASLVRQGASVTVAPFVMVLGGQLIGLPNVRNPRVLAYAVVKPAADLTALANQVGNVDSTNFLPHVTVARAKTHVALPQVPDLARLAIPVNSFCLMNSELGRKGAAYIVIKEFPLH